MDIYYKAIPCTGEKKEFPKDEGWYWTLWGSSCEVSYFEPNPKALPRIKNKWYDKEEDDVTSVITHWLKKVEIPSPQDVGIEIIARYPNGNNRGVPIAKKAFVHCYNWMIDKINNK